MLTGGGLVDLLSRPVLATRRGGNGCGKVSSEITGRLSVLISLEHVQCATVSCGLVRHVGSDTKKQQRCWLRRLSDEVYRRNKSSSTSILTVFPAGAKQDRHRSCASLYGCACTCRKVKGTAGSGGTKEACVLCALRWEAFGLGLSAPT